MRDCFVTPAKLWHAKRKCKSKISNFKKLVIIRNKNGGFSYKTVMLSVIWP